MNKRCNMGYATDEGDNLAEGLAFGIIIIAIAIIILLLALLIYLL